MPRTTRTIRVVVDIESDPPQVLGTYSRTGEEVVAYVRADGVYTTAPADCVVVLDLDLYPAATKPLTSLEALHKTLSDLVDHIDDDANVPERYEGTAKATIARLDTGILGLAAGVVHRLMLWDKHPNVSPERYFAPGRGPSQ
jgi:hypothetical protein